LYPCILLGLINDDVVKTYIKRMEIEN
jgi:hypothetical protein